MRDGITFSLSKADRQRLSDIAAAPLSPQKHVWRARIVLLSSDGLGTSAIMAATGKSKTCVWRWQERFMDEGVDGLLRDKSRPPGKAPVPSKREAEIIRLTQEPPVNPVPAERPFTARERIDTGGANLSVSVTDSDGAHEVPITGGEFVHLVGPFERVVRELAGAGFEVPPTAAAGAPATITLGDHALRVLGDDMFAEVTGTPEALELFRQRVPRARR